ncbi:MAG: NUDIX domain-containing protein [Bacteroidetes bacterium]|nr:MAG: NUDIX domain-containing protein [Bacteroidota bacterium]
MLQFKELPEGERSIDRPGSYVIMTREEELVMVRIIGWGKYFLPGGGIDDGEQPEEALIREVKEETGYFVTDLEKICEAAEFIYSPVAGAYLNKQGVYYSARILDQDVSLIIEEDHEIVYLPVAQALGLLHLESQQWAVKQWLNNNNGKTKA